jgi:acetyl-CoA carboxylase carboxyltransferase component
MRNTTDTLARQRVCSLLDDQSFMEIGSLVAARSTDFNLGQIDTPTDGVITGYGLIDGNLVYVYCQDATILHGTIGEMHSKKIAALYDMAMKMGAPIIGMIDCAGIRLQESVDALHGLGEIYTKQALASGVIPQICAVFGRCGGGLSVLPALSDFVFLEEKESQLFVNSPNAIKGNHREKCNTASAQYQSEFSGIVDGTGTAAEIISQIRDLIPILPGNYNEGGCQDECLDDLNRVCENLADMREDTRLVLSAISDNNLFFEVKQDYAKDMVAGLIKLNGITIGAVANRTAVYDEDGKKCEQFLPELSAKGCSKAAEFIKFCDAFDIPVLTLTNVAGFRATHCSEKRLARAMSQLTATLVTANIPKVNILIGEAYGSAYTMMNSKAVGADLVYAWEDSKVGMMDPQQAAQIMFENGDAKQIKEQAAEYEKLQSSVLSAAKRGYVDLIIQPQDTRKYAIAAFEMLYTKQMEGPIKKHGAK